METAETIPQTQKRRKKGGRYVKKQKRLSGIFSLIYFAVTFAYIELIFHFREFQNFSAVFPVLFAIPAGFFAGMLCNLFPERIARILRYVISAGVMVLFCVQIVYFHSFQSFMSLSQVGMGGDVFTNFFKTIMLAIWECMVPILLIFMPLVGLYFLQKRMSQKRKFDWKNSVISAVAWILSYVLVILMLPIAGTGDHSAYANFHNNWVLDLSMEKLVDDDRLGHEILGFRGHTGRSGGRARLADSSNASK